MAVLFEWWGNRRAAEALRAAEQEAGKQSLKWPDIPADDEEDYGTVENPRATTLKAFAWTLHKMADALEEK